MDKDLNSHGVRIPPSGPDAMGSVLKSLRYVHLSRTAGGANSHSAVLTMGKKAVTIIARELGTL